MSEFRLPDVGEGLTEAEIVSWRVSVGDEVDVNDVLVEIETAKSLVELPSPFAGRVRSLLVAEGDTVAVGTPIIAIGEEALVPATPAAERHEVLVGYGPREGRSHRRRRARRAPATPRPVAPSRPLAKPPVRKLAKDLGVDLADIPCDGIITRSDVETFALRHSERGPQTTSGMTQREPGETRVPVKGVRKAMADAMVASVSSAPQVTEWITLDVSRTMALVERLRVDPAFADIKVSPLLLVARAVCLAVRRTPELNATWAGDEIVLNARVNLGIAAATDRGLVVPNIPDAQAKTLRELAVALRELAATARADRTPPTAMTGGTFTITNIGVFGIDAGTPILNPGETGILAVGAIERRPWVDEDDQIVPRWVTTLALTFDHRVADGQQASRFLADVAAILREPDLALTY